MQTRHAEKGAAHPASAAVEISVADVLEAVMTSLEDSKAESPVTIDIQGKSALGDYMVIASGRSHRHVGAIADHLLRDLKNLGLDKPRVEGLPNCDWVLIDTGDIIVHIFRPEVREFYGIERMWLMPDHSEVH
ncbi:MAG: ribosome silencing factor [Nitratireductor sp.]|nr:ribosome silencing factor [Nitratireductor sp.]